MRGAALVARCRLTTRAETAPADAPSTSGASQAWRVSAAGALSALAVLGSAALAPSSAYATTPGLDSSTYFFDSGRLLSADKRDKLNTDLSEFSKRTGWNVRIYTAYGPGTAPPEDDLRAAWGPLGKNSVVVGYDATAPSLINVPYLGDDVLATLKRPWWGEFKGRFGNLFYVREQGEQTAITVSTQVLMECLGKPGGCLVVPGVPDEQYFITLTTSIAGGLVAGFVSRLEPQGFVQSRWVWLLLFSPVWGSLYINFGLGPIVSRTEDKLPILQNTLGFAVGAAAPYLAQVLRAPPVKDGQQ
ncbi:hypothetical protein HYH02_000790 [Chlamydomonas schloesseri]|uniref:TPM domain-containing protein n=1 Tax=Chlamydomonas schloesseri TaxID=2026947 RepID=A0A835WVA4_9CHLO|nr:hypothetical protein HYH02_000790 [Chlamydomonas schloesseri]|eukprot:KAG2454964.1 hypothetical protein HYH02_000790 [Chlamydomonas schloesseri]